jgi:hypothetical protein
VPPPKKVKVPLGDSPELAVKPDVTTGNCLIVPCCPNTPFH